MTNVQSLSNQNHPILDSRTFKQSLENHSHLLRKLWIYTNYNCNLRCKYCTASSTPRAPKRAISTEVVKRLVNEAVEASFQEILFTGGEPLVLGEIFEMIDYSAERVKTTILTNAILFRGKRLERFAAISPQNLTVQVSLDGGRAEHHDAYRGPGTWENTVAGIRAVQEKGFHVRLSTTETPANSQHLQEICVFHNLLGIPEDDHFIRPLARRGFSLEGMEVSKTTLMPEITIDRDGVYWHPLSTESDMKVCQDIFPLVSAVEYIQEQLLSFANNSAPQEEFT